MQEYLNADVKKQVEAIYAMQIYAETKGQLKNFLSILFHQMYDLEIIEEEAFYQWKDELNDNYPNKGQALFHVIIVSLSLSFFKFLMKLFLYCFVFLVAKMVQLVK